MKKNGSILVLTGPSGAGKDTITNLLLSQSNFTRFPTCTTRAPRPGEINGVHYHFVDKATFSQYWDDGLLLDRAGIHDFYGLPIHSLKAEFQKGRRLILHLVPPSAQLLKKILPETIIVLLLPPTESESSRRLLRRGMSAEDITRRLENDQTKNHQERDYNLMIVNETGQAEEATKKILDYIAFNRGLL